MRNKIRWGVLGVAKIATEKVIPAMQGRECCDVVAIASRELAKAQSASAKLGIPRAYGSYEDLLKDPEVDAIYNPLPNHMHVPWSIRAAEAGKHVLCEKPLSLTVAECRTLITARDHTGVKMGEAFMVRTHPQWVRARELVRGGEIGELRSIVGMFSFFNRDPKNIRNIPKYGGGAVMDIGCYPINTSRFIFGQEPVRVAGLVERDPEMGTDRLTTAMLEYPSGHCIFTCSTQLIPYQRMQIMGTRGRIEIEIPFNAPLDRSCRIFIDRTGDLFGKGTEVEEFPVANQYQIQGERFSRALLDGAEVPVPLEDSLGNMAVIEAVLRAGQSGAWERP